MLHACKSTLHVKNGGSIEKNLGNKLKNGIIRKDSTQIRNFSRGRYFRRKRDYGEPKHWPVQPSKNQITWSQKWYYDDKNPFEWLEPKIPEPAFVGMEDPKDEFLTERQKGTTRTIRMHLPQRYNSLTPTAVQRLHDYVVKYNTSPANEQVTNWILQGSDQAWCTGYDLKYMYDNKDSREVLQMLRTMHRTVENVHKSKTAVIAVLDGIVTGAGCGLALNAPFRVATDRTVFAVQDCEYGFIPNPGVCYALSKYGPMGMFLALSGYKLNGTDMMHAGLATHYVPVQSLPGLKHSLGECDRGDCDQIFTNIHEASESVKGIRYSLLEHLHSINECFSKPTLAGVITALKRDGSLWAQTTLDRMNKSNPVSIAMTFEMIRRSKGMDIAESLRQDYILAQSFLKGKDFSEGFEKLVLSRTEGQSPKWSYKSIDEVLTNLEKVGKQYFEVGDKHQLRLDNRGNSQLFEDVHKFLAFAKHHQTPGSYEEAEKLSTFKDYYFDIDKAVNEADDQMIRAETKQLENSEEVFISKVESTISEIEKFLSSQGNNIDAAKRKTMQQELQSLKSTHQKLKEEISEEFSQKKLFAQMKSVIDKRTEYLQRVNQGEDELATKEDEGEDVIEDEYEDEEDSLDEYEDEENALTLNADDVDIETKVRELGYDSKEEMTEEQLELLEEIAHYRNMNVDKTAKAFDDHLSAEARMERHIEEYLIPPDFEDHSLTAIEDYNKRKEIKSDFEDARIEHIENAQRLASEIESTYSTIIHDYTFNLKHLAQEKPKHFIQQFGPFSLSYYEQKALQSEAEELSGAETPTSTPSVTEKARQKHTLVTDKASLPNLSSIFQEGIRHDEDEFAERSKHLRQISDKISRIRILFDKYQEEQDQLEWEYKNTDKYSENLRAKPKISWLDERTANSDMELAELYTLKNAAGFARKWKHNVIPDVQAQSLTDQIDKMRAQKYHRSLKLAEIKEFNQLKQNVVNKKLNEKDYNLKYEVGSDKMADVTEQSLSLKRAQDRQYEYSLKMLQFLENNNGQVFLGKRRDQSIFEKLTLLEGEYDVKQSDLLKPVDRYMPINEAYSGMDDERDFFTTRSGEVITKSDKEYDRDFTLGIKNDYVSNDVLENLNRDDILFGERSRYFEQIEYDDPELLEDWSSYSNLHIPKLRDPDNSL